MRGRGGRSWGFWGHCCSAWVGAWRPGFQDRVSLLTDTWTGTEAGGLAFLAHEVFLEASDNAREKMLQQCEKAVKVSFLTLITEVSAPALVKWGCSVPAEKTWRRTQLSRGRAGSQAPGRCRDKLRKAELKPGWRAPWGAPSSRWAVPAARAVGVAGGTADGRRGSREAEGGRTDGRLVTQRVEARS